jgi:hypothetical protein
MSVLFLGLLPLFAVFHLTMWFCFTRTLFRAETGSSKRIGYLVTLEDRYGPIVAQEPQTGSVIALAGSQNPPPVRTVVFGDSFSDKLAKACSTEWHQPVGIAKPAFGQKDAFAQLMTWLKDDWFRQHGVKTIIVEHRECEWIESFDDYSDDANEVSWEQEIAGGIPSLYRKAVPWTFANNGNFKVIMYNVAYLFSPTAFNMTDTGIAHLDRPFFNCSYSKLLVFYRGDLLRGIWDKQPANGERAIENLKRLSDLCHAQGLNFYLIIAPNKSSLYRDWVIHPFYPASHTLPMLREKATPYGYVDVDLPLHQALEAGVRDLYFPDDLHWTYAAADLAAKELTKAGAEPAP